MSRGLQDHTCECCTDQFGWIWNLDEGTAEPCPVCNGEGNVEVYIGSTAEGSHGWEPIYAEEPCDECAGTGTVYPTLEPVKRSNQRPASAPEIAELPF